MEESWKIPELECEGILGGGKQGNQYLGQWVGHGAGGRLLCIVACASRARSLLIIGNWYIRANCNIDYYIIFLLIFPLSLDVCGA